MHTVKIFVWENDWRLHLCLISANILLLISLIIRFEWPLIKKRLRSSDENQIENNIKHNTMAPRNKEIQLTKMERSEIEQKDEHKYNRNFALNTKEKTKRRRKSIEFYRRLFSDTSTSNKIIVQQQQQQQQQYTAEHTRNDSVNLRAHQQQRPSSFEEDIPDIDSIVDIERGMPSLMEILRSKIYDDRNKVSVRFRYRYILYIPVLVFVLLSIVYHSVPMSDEWVYYAYPMYEVLLGAVLWCEIDIVILSCGGAHVVEECLEVQISANGHEYKCIYCCWCDLSVLRLCNCCTMDNALSLFKCHHSFMKILICLICPLLTIVVFLISELRHINEPLSHTKIGDLIPSLSTHSHSSLSLYWLLIAIVAILYVILIFTATYIGILIVKSLHFVSSLKPKTLILQYLTSIILTFVMQIQLVIFVLYYQITPTFSRVGCLYIPNVNSYMLLVYVEFIIASVLNHFAFQNIDFEHFGREAIEKNKVQLFDFQPDFDSIHDLHNYKRVYGDTFLLNVNGKRNSNEQRPAKQKQKVKSNKKGKDIELEFVIDGINSQTRTNSSQKNNNKHSVSLELNNENIYAFDQSSSSSHSSQKKINTSIP